MLKQILSLSKDLIAIPSVSSDKGQLPLVLERAEQELKGYTIERFERNGIPSLLAYNTPTRPEKFKLILNGHLDVVPGKPEQFTAFEKEGKLYGRGADDMKAATAVLILLFKELAKQVKYPLAIQLVTDEETGGMDGVKYQINRGVVADFFITGETTQFNIKNEAKGIVVAKIKATGVTGHGAYPWKGENAAWKIVAALNKLQKAYPTPKEEVWATTLNLAALTTSNTAHNKIPDYAEALLDFRYIPADKPALVNKIKALLPEGVEFEIIENEPCHFTEPKNEYLEKLKTLTEKALAQEIKIQRGHGASDARHYAEKGMAGIEFGPFGSGLHSDSERVDIKGLELYYQVLQDFLLSL